MNKDIILESLPDHMWIICSTILSFYGFMQSGFLGVTNLILLSKNKTFVEVKSIGVKILIF